MLSCFKYTLVTTLGILFAAFLQPAAIAQPSTVPIPGEFFRDKNGGSDANFGNSVDVGFQGSTPWLVIGQPKKGDGHVTFYRYNSVQVCSISQTRCESSSSCSSTQGICGYWIEALDDSRGSNGKFGHSVAMTEDASFAIVGAPDGKKAYLYRRDNDDWVGYSSFDSPFPAQADFDKFGWSVDIEESGGSVTAIIGAPALDGDPDRFGNNAIRDLGGVTVIRRDNDEWVEIASERGETRDGNLGWDVAIKDSVFYVSEPGFDESKGRVVVKYGDSMEHSYPIAPEGRAAGDEFGISIDVDTGRLIAGTLGNPNAIDPEGGYADIFREDQAPQIDPPQDPIWVLDQRIDDADGWSVAIKDSNALISSPSENSVGLYFRNSDTDSWQLAETITPAAAGDTGVRPGTVFPGVRSYNFSGDCAVNNEGCLGDRFGDALSLSSSLALVGAPYAEEGIDSSGDVYSPGHDGGLAYVYTVKVPVPPGGLDYVEIGKRGTVAIEYMIGNSSIESMLLVQGEDDSSWSGGCVTDDVTISVSGGVAFKSVLESTRSRYGCRSYGGGVWNTSTRQLDSKTYEDGDEFNFRIRVLNDDVDYVAGVYDDSANYVEYSSVPSENPSSEKRVDIKAVLPDGWTVRKDGVDTLLDLGGRIYQLAWNLDDDGEFDDLLVVLRVADDPDTADVIELDMDGDGLWDDWEVRGIDWNGNFKIEPARGENLSGRSFYDHKDLFVEVDYMGPCPTYGGLDIEPTIGCEFDQQFFAQDINHTPDPAALNLVKRAFAASPVTNPDGETGINLVFDVSDSIPHVDIIAPGDDPCPVPNTLPVETDCVNYSDIKSKWFPGRTGERGSFVRYFTHRYLVYGHSHSPSAMKDGALGSSGGLSELPGDDFMVTRGQWGNTFSSGNSFQRASAYAVVLMHELGHALSLSHGGFTDNDGVTTGSFNYKPNYLSIMNYNFSAGKGIPVSLDPPSSAFLLDYSRQTLSPLNESSLNESTGIGVNVPIPPNPVFLDEELIAEGYVMDSYGTRYYCGKGEVKWSAGTDNINWNCNGVPGETGVQADINYGDVQIVSDSTQTLTGYDDWSNIRLSFLDLASLNGSWAAADRQGTPLLSEPGLLPEMFEQPTPDAGSVADGDPISAPLVDGLYEPYSCLLGSSATLDGSGSFNNNHEIEQYDWYFADGAEISASGATANYPCAEYVGVVPIQLTITDAAGNMAIDDSAVVVSVEAGDDQVLQCGKETVIGGSVPVYSQLTYRWTSSSGALLGTTPRITRTLNKNESEQLTLKVTDSRDVSVSDSLLLNVEDTTAPEIDIRLSQSVIWDPDHRLVPIDVFIEVSDICDESPKVRLISITSNEPDNALEDDGNTINDIQGAEFGTDDRSFLLRAERLGTGNGRVYTITYETEDASRNTTLQEAKVRVPLSCENGACETLPSGC